MQKREGRFLCCTARDSSCNCNIVMEGFTVICYTVTCLQLNVLKLNNISGITFRLNIVHM